MKYNETLLDPPGPIVNVLVRSSAHTKPTLEFSGKIDTGADATVIPLALVDELQLVPRFRMMTQGYDGVMSERLGYEVDLVIEGCTIESVQVIATPRATILLGRDVLAHFIITLDGKAQTFEMVDP
jgi:predicted aspartyl protease